MAPKRAHRNDPTNSVDIEAFVRLGCQQCIIYKMRRAPIRALVDKTLAPPGKKWAYDTLTLKVKTTAGNIYITRFLDEGSGLKRSYGHADFTSQEQPTPTYIDSASTVFVAQSRGAVKKSAWMRRRAEVLTQAYDLGEIMPIKIEEYNNFADPQTKYLTYKVWARHLHYTHNLSGEPPPPVEKASKKGPEWPKGESTLLGDPVVVICAPGDLSR